MIIFITTMNLVITLINGFLMLTACNFFAKSDRVFDICNKYDEMKRKGNGT